MSLFSLSCYNHDNWKIFCLFYQCRAETGIFRPESPKSPNMKKKKGRFPMKCLIIDAVHSAIAEELFSIFSLVCRNFFAFSRASSPS